MFTKKLVFLFSSILLSGSILANAQSENSNAKIAKAKSVIQKMSKEEISNYYKKAHSRIPATNPETVKLSKKQANDSKQKAQTLKAVNSLPSNMIFPGEFEEVKAILITWPYITLDSNGNYDPMVSIDNTFGDFGTYVDYKNYPNITQSFGKVTTVLDLFDDSSFPPIFAKLAKAIDENAEVWINIFHAEDSTEILNYMKNNGMALKNARFFVNYGNSFWYRDCGPVAFYYGDKDSVGFIDFEYYGGRPMDDLIPIKVAEKAGYPVFTTSIEFEGGNILLDGMRNLFTTDAVYSTNMDDYGLCVREGDSLFYEAKTPLTKAQVNDSLKALLNLDVLKVLPKLKNDGGTGHIDLYVDMWDENNMVFSQMPTAMKTFPDYKITAKNVDSIMAMVKSDGHKYRKTYIPFPKKDDGTWYKNASDYDSLTRTYSNHTFVNKAIIQPVFASETSGDLASMQADLDSIKARYPGYKIYPIDIRQFDGYGGAIHCITKQIPAENPIRIIHYPIHDSVETKSLYNLNVKAYNHSGIEKTVCKWRYKGSTEWNSFDLTAVSANEFNGNIVNDRNEGVIEYYIESKSVNGKTIAKPITAPEGFYKFNFGAPLSVENYIEEGIDEFYPNPAESSTTINISQTLPFELNIVDALGNTVYAKSVQMSSEYNAISINTTSFNSGSYIAVFKLANGNVIKKKLNVVK